MLNTYKKALTYVSIGFLLLCVSPSIAQEQKNKHKVNTGADIVSRYFWRGFNISTSPAIQPYIEYNIAGFTLGTWGSYSISTEPFQEIDLYMSYQHNNVKLTVTDCFTIIDSMDVSQNYLDWNNNSTAHTIQANLEISHLFKSPVSFIGGAYIHGADKDEFGENYFSTYLEAQYDFNVGEQVIKAFAGCTPFEGLYSDSFAFVNVGITLERDILFSKEISLPFTATFAINPQTEGAFMVAKISF